MEGAGSPLASPQKTIREPRRQNAFGTVIQAVSSDFGAGVARPVLHDARAVNRGSPGVNQVQMPPPPTVIAACRSCGARRAKPLTFEVIRDRLERVLEGVSAKRAELDIRSVVELEALSDEVAGYCLACSPRMRAISKESKELNR